jgi:chloride channel protein, CIC family
MPRASWRVRKELARVRRTARAPVSLAGEVWDAFLDWFNARELSENAILLVFAVVIGALGSLGVVGFYKLIDLAFTIFYRWTGERLPFGDLLFYRPAITAAGFVCAWWIVKRAGKGYEGMNVPDVQLAVARRGGYLAARPALARTAASAVTLGSGGSAGSEGPVAVLGSAIGSFLGRSFRFAPARVRVLVGAGAAAGISAAFNAPLAGAFFALEEILGSLAVGAFPPVVVSSVVAAVVSRAFFGNHPAFPIPEEYGYALTREVFLFYPLLGIVAGLVSVLYVRSYFGAERVARRFRIHPAALAAIGGLIVGALVVVSGGQLVGYGHLALRLDLFGRMPLLVLALLALGKILATSITLNAGGSGGVFTPSLYIGAVTGGAFGVALTGLFPDLALRPEAYALVGMGAVVAAATAAPITGILIVFEMTNDYAIVLPLMITAVIAWIIAHRIEPDSLYSGWLRRRGETIVHGRNRDVLEGLRVADALERNPPVINENATLTELLEHLSVSGHTDFPVVDDEYVLIGVITMADIGRAAKDHADLAGLLVAADLAAPTETVSPDDSLFDAVKRLGTRGATMIPVVSRDTGRLVGITSRAQILALYERAVVATPDEHGLGH